MASLGSTGPELLDAVFEGAPFGVYVDDPTEGCTFANPFLLSQFGVDWEDFCGFGWARFVVEEDVARMQVAIQEYEHSRKAIRVTYRVRHGDGSLRWVHARVRAVVDAAGEHVGSIGLTTDVTEQREFEERVGSTQKLEAVGRLAARLAHDLNNLLTVIMGSAEHLEASVGSLPEEAQSLDAISLACDQARQLTEQLLLLSRRRVRTRASCDLDAELTRLSRLLQGTLGERITLDLALDAADAHVPLDASALGQIVLNLATNARDAMDGQGELRLATLRDETTTTILVEDEGHGMDAEILERAFEPFFTTKDEGQGTGLGLSTLRDLTEVVGGSIGLDSEVGRGTTARVILPIVTATAKVRTSPVAAASATPCHILIVEDNEAVRQSVAYALALVGHSVESAGSLAEARIRVGESEPFDVIVSDVLLPDGSGVDLYHELTADDEVPVVFMSGFAGRDADLLSGLTGPAEFVPKPFRSQAIV